jgi:hypothetical protein
MILGRQPVAITAVISVAINLALTFGLRLTADQVALINALVVAVIALIVGTNVTPVAFPRLNEGTEVEIITPGPEDNLTVTL